MKANEVLDTLKDVSQTNLNIIRRWKKYYLQLKKLTTNIRNLKRTILSNVFAFQTEYSLFVLPGWTIKALFTQTWVTGFNITTQLVRTKAVYAFTLQ